ncbi:MAG: response regulator [Candidatus Rokuibacteriota bacterium]
MSAPAARILVVDDEVDVQEVVVDVLSEGGYQVEAVGSAAEALEALARDAWDLVIADVRLGDQPGPELAREIARRQPALSNRIIFVTGDLATAPDCAPVIRKPFTVDAVLDAVGERLSS